MENVYKLSGNTVEVTSGEATTIVIVDRTTGYTFVINTVPVTAVNQEITVTAS